MDVAQVEVLLREQGYSLTPQRRAILAYLAHNDQHPTASQIHEAVTRELPISSRATVYNTITLLKELGVLREVAVAGGETRLDPNTAPHHHFRCLSCGALADLPQEHVTLQVAPETGFTITSASVTIEGTCADCG